MSRQYEESIFDTLAKVYSPLMKFLAIIGIFALIFVSINIFGEGGNLDEGYSYNEYIVRDNNMAIGPEDAQVTLVHLYDLQCPVCAGYDPVMKSIKDEYKDRVRIVYKHNPLEDLHPLAPQGARAVQAAALQGDDKGFEYSSLVLANQESGLSSRNLKKWAEQAGLDVNKWNSDRTSFEVRRMVRWDIKDIENSTFPESINKRGDKPNGKLTGTPANVIYIDGKFEAYIAGSEPLENMKTYLDQALAKAAASNPATPNSDQSSDASGQTMPAGTPVEEGQEGDLAQR